MSVEENKELIRRFAEEIFNERNVDAVDNIIADNYIQHTQGVPPGREGTKMFMTALLTAFPDMEMTFEHVLADGDMLAGHWRIIGTHQAELMGIPATGRPVNITGVDIFRVENGKFVEHWDCWDQMGLMQQLGVIPAPAQS